jgi:hypothetical protein
MTVTSFGLAAPRSRRPGALAVVPALLGLASVGVLGWRAMRAGRPAVKGSASGRPCSPFAFTWQMPEEVSASAASGH